VITIIPGGATFFTETEEAPNRTSVVPYLTGGVGGMTMFERRDLTVNPFLGTEERYGHRVYAGVLLNIGR
jgi:hypothetical protein